MENYNKMLEDNLLEVVKQKEQSDKRLLRMELLTGILSLIPLIASMLIITLVPMEEWIASVIVCSCILPLFIAAPFMIKIEQTAGYYECAECDHRYIPTYKSVFFSAHMHTTRYMRCPKCGKKSWQKKVISKE